jgi:hypothetical protein
MFRLILVARKYGPSRIEYNRIPIRTGDTAILKWWPPSGLTVAASLTFILRCVEEWTETTGSGKHRNTKLIHEQIWGAERSATNTKIHSGTPIELTYDIPAGEHGSNLSDDHLVTFWEFEVNAETPGVDFVEQYLVPIQRL